VAADIPKIDERGRRVVVHSTRNTFATMLNVAGVAPRIARQTMRHSDISLTMKKYTDDAQPDVAGAVASLPSIDGWFGSSDAPGFAPDCGKMGQKLSQIGKSDPSETSGENTKKPLVSLTKPRVFLSRGDRIRTYDPLVPNQMR
jgi:hypothetical protein